MTVKQKVYNLENKLGIKHLRVKSLVKNFREAA